MRNKHILFILFAIALGFLLFLQMPRAGVSGQGNSMTAIPIDSTQVAGTLPPYQIAADFSNVVMTAKLSQDQMALLQKNDFVVIPGKARDFYGIYKLAWEQNQPLFITTDSMLYSFHLVFDKILRTSEVKFFLPAIKTLNQGMLNQADKNYQALKSTDWADAAKQVVAYLSVGLKLADNAATIPDYVQDMVQQEVANITNAAGISPSAVFPDLSNGEDWSQYIPRGHYTLSDDLKTYFRILMYYGRMVFRISNKGETRAAVLLTMALRDTNVDGRQGIDIWNSIYEPTSFLIGKSDEPTVQDYTIVFGEVYGPNADLKAVQAADVDSFVQMVSKLPAPRILSAIVKDNQDITQQTAGLSLLGQRFSWDAYIFNQLVYKNVGTQDNPRKLPVALDLFAAMGSRGKNFFRENTR